MGQTDLRVILEPRRLDLLELVTVVPGANEECGGSLLGDRVSKPAAKTQFLQDRWRRKVVGQNSDAAGSSY